MCTSATWSSCAHTSAYRTPVFLRHRLAPPTLSAGFSSHWRQQQQGHRPTVRTTRYTTASVPLHSSHGFPTITSRMVPAAPQAPLEADLNDSSSDNFRASRLELHGQRRRHGQHQTERGAPSSPTTSLPLLQSQLRPLEANSMPPPSRVCRVHVWISTLAQLLDTCAPESHSLADPVGAPD